MCGMLLDIRLVVAPTSFNPTLNGLLIFMKAFSGQKKLAERSLLAEGATVIRKIRLFYILRN